MNEKESIHPPLYKSLAPSSLQIFGGTVWKVEFRSTLPVPQADCRRYLGQAFPLKKICLGHVPGSALGTTAGTAGSFTVIWEPGLICCEWFLQREEIRI